MPIFVVIAMFIYVNELWLATSVVLTLMLLVDRGSVKENC